MSTLDQLCLSFAVAIIVYAAVCVGFYLDGYFGKRRK